MNQHYGLKGDKDDDYFKKGPSTTALNGNRAYLSKIF